MSDEFNELQNYLIDLYEEYRRVTRQRNPSDAKFAAWIGAKSSAYNHWAQGYRAPDLISCVKISAALARNGVQDHLRIFDICGYDRIYTAYTPTLEKIILHYNDFPPELKAEIETQIDRIEREKMA